MRRVVVTGLGCISPVGNTVDETWQAIKDGKSGVAAITRYDATPFKVKYAAEVKNFDASKYMDSSAARKMGLFSRYAVAAAKMALEDSDLLGKADILEDTAVYLGVGIGGLEVTENTMKAYFESNYTRMPPMTIPELIPNEAAGNISLAFGLHGATHTVATACASGTDAIGDALDQIRCGRYDVILAGGAESTQCGYGNLGFTMLHALSSKWVDDPSKASRPFDKQRDGFIMGEGSTILVLEEYEHAKARGAKIYAEVAGYGGSTDGYHLTAPNPNGIPGAKCMTIAMKDAGVKPEEVTYYNAHGTSTHLNDSGETKMLHIAFGDAAKKLHISSTKSMTGHCLGNAGSLEAMICIKAIQDSYIPATINLDEVDVEGGCDLDYTPNHGLNMNVDVAMSANFGFGGHNGCLVFKKVK
ncbi:beta-ketoacyl-[acyl-carrier-protein] synthase II [Treponema rectale]|uniref:3-oxoacyl-[acyl-carrier-protein] synthase 2 n=1 Tax=Treponema rectale TaxID=744512 RepID=A0A840SJ38_9SPIR|nr:beta-ketoacyl-ACP synthase II [Treponema rectale]MBB5219401.1 3-oxoacyl-[acyl-carrier-protein] synthase II [Treponema rectale]QOS40719.1 beta-ketoacyl-[acyl-carrier-protein] synthase II [Treponema rectale]